MKIRTKIGLIAVTVIAAVILAFYVRSKYTLTRLELSQSTYYTESQMREWLVDNKWKEQTWYLYLFLRFGEPPQLPFVQEMEAELVDSHTIRITVYEKEVVGCIRYMGEYVCFDKDGVMVGSVIERRSDVPVIKGIEYERIVFNEEVQTNQNHLFDTILALTQQIRKNHLAVETVEFDPDRNVSLYAGEICVRLGKNEKYDETLSALSEILKEAEGLSGELQMQNYSMTNQTVIFVENEP